MTRFGLRVANYSLKKALQKQCFFIENQFIFDEILFIC